MRALLRRPLFVGSLLLTFSVLSLLGVAAAFAVCGATAYSVTASAPPPIANWTSTSGVWQPAGGFPGCGSGDSASDTNASPTTLVINSSIPNPIVGLNLSCNGCVIDIQSGGSLTLAGAGTIGSGATLHMSGGSLTIANGGSLNFASGSTYQHSSGFVEVQSGGSMTVPSSSTVSAGMLQLTGGTLNVPSGGTLTIANGATFELDGGSVNGGTVANSGLVEVQTSPVTIGSVLNNNSGGAVTVTSSQLSLTGGGTGDSAFTISSGAVLDFPSGAYIMTPNGTVSGAGTLQVSGGTLSIGGVTAPAIYVMTGGTLTGAGFLNVTQQFLWHGGTITGAGGAQLAGTGTGTIDGSTAAIVLDGRSFDDYGSMDLNATANQLTLANGAVFSVYGTLNMVTGDVDCNCSTPATLNVAPNGYLLHSSATTSVIYSQFTNSAYVSSFNGGTLTVAGSGTHSGQFDASANSFLEFAAPSVTFGPSSYIAGQGTIDFASGDITVNGTLQPTHFWIQGATAHLNTGGQTDYLRFDSGTMYLTGNFHVTTDGDWAGGTISSPSGVFIVDAPATFAITGASCDPILDSATFENHGTATYSNATPSTTQFIFRNNSAFNNYGTFTITGDRPIASQISVIIGDATTPHRGRVASQAQASAVIVTSNIFDNMKTFEKTSASTTNFEPDFTNSDASKASSGTLHFFGTYTQTAGTTTLGAGDITVANPLLLNGGALNGTGTITGDVNSSAGSITPGTSGGVGAITITGNYTQQSGASFTSRIGGPTTAEYDRLIVGNAAALDGSFTGILINGYQPPNGATFPVLTFASRTGAFATETLPTYPPHGSMTSSYTPTSYVLTAVVSPSVADLAAGMTGPSSVTAGAPLSYDIQLTNGGPDPTSGTTTVVDTLPAGATAASGSGTGWSCGPPSGGTITCTTTAGIASGGTYPVLTIAMTAPAAGGSVSNSATASLAMDSNGANNTASVSTTVVASADLLIGKSGPGGVTAGQNITYTVTVTNNGPSTAANVVVSDPTPANLTFVGNTGACTSPFPCSLGNLTSGQSAVITSTYSTSANFSGNVSNVATVSSTTNDPNNTNNSASASTNVGAQADLAITKTTTATSVTPGQNITYTVKVTNNGPSPATSVVVSDPTPVGLAFQSNAGACTSAYPCAIGTLPSGQSATITSTYTVPNNYSGVSVANTATVSSAVNDPNTTDNSATATTPVAQSADLAITKTGPSSIGQGQLITYTITVLNLGPSTASGVTVNDNTPAGLTFVSTSGACTSAFPCALGSIPSGQSATITATYNVPSNYPSATIVNTATVSSLASDPNGGNNSSTATTNVVAQADVAIVKSGPASYTAGQTVTYTVVVTNNGPLSAANTFVTDPTPSGLTFTGNTGGCTTPYPCALGTLTSGQSVTISSTYSVPPSFSGPITNTASVSSSTSDTNTTNNSSTVVTPAASGGAADLSIAKSGPGHASPNAVVTFTITVHNNGPADATNVSVADVTPSGFSFVSNSGGCTTPYPCALGTVTAGQTVTITSKYVVQAQAGGSVTNTAHVTASTTDSNATNNTDSVTVQVTACPSIAPTPLAPLATDAVGSPVTFSWSDVPLATNYRLTIINANGTPMTIDTQSTSAKVDLPSGAFSWFVQAFGTGNCQPTSSRTITINICSIPAAPVASVVGETTTGYSYNVSWTAVSNVQSYELQESPSPDFTNPTSTTMTSRSKTFTKLVNAATGFYYRVRAISACGANAPFSPVIRVVVVPLPAPETYNPTVSVPAGGTQPVTFQIFVPGLPNVASSFVATVDKPWLSVTPTSGIVPPEGMLLTVTADARSLANGTWTGTVIVVYGSGVTGASKLSSNATTLSKSFPVSVSLVTPVTPAPVETPVANALVIPSIGHLAGFASSWRSDVRVANLTSNIQKFLLTFNSGSGDANALTKQTTISVDPGATTALDDIVKSWYGIGALGDSSNGLLTVQQLDASGAPTGANDLLRTLAVSSRTYNATGNGTLGQFIPAVPLAAFIGKAGGSSSVPSLLSLQQLAQNDAYRTNVGVTEAAGKPVSLVLSAFSASGSKLFELPIDLKAGEQRQLNGLFALNNVTTSNARIEVRATNGEGRATAYASVVDSHTNDPLLVSGAPLGAAGADRYVVPGVADLDTGAASWRTDMRLFNSGSVPQKTTFTFFPLGNATASVSKDVTVNPGEITPVDDVVKSLFGLANVGGSVHITTPAPAPLVVTARTYDVTGNGTLGQFIPAVTARDGVGNGERSLQILQAEDSMRYRTNVGLVEISGKPAVVEVQVNLPDSRVTPTIQVPLAAFESRQFPVLSSLGLGATYNARISVRVIDGDGRITAYGSVIDQQTLDPTYVPAQ